MHTLDKIGASDKTDGAAIPDTDPHQLLTVDDVAALLKVSKSWVYEHTRAAAHSRTERLPHIRIGKYLRFDPHAVRTFLARHTRTR